MRKLLLGCRRRVAVLMAFLMALSLLPAGLLEGFDLVTVANAATLGNADLPAEWDFKAATEAVTIEGTTGEYNGLIVDATSGKLAVRVGDWAQFNSGTIIKVPVAGACEVTVVNYDTNYSVDGTAAETAEQTFTCAGTDGYVTITATANSYIGSITVALSSAGTDTGTVLDSSKIDVWDFGAEELAGVENNLTADVINAWYDSSYEAGTSGATLGAFSAVDSNGITAVKFVTSKTNNRLRTENTALTRYDAKSKTGDDGVKYTGYIYSNTSSSDAVMLQFYLYEGDILTCMLGSNSNSANYIMRDPSGEDYAEFAYTNTSGVETAVFYASDEGWYSLYCSNEKLVCARITREHTPVVTVEGTVTAPDDIPSGYSVVFTNTVTGKETESVVSDNAYSVSLNGKYSYTVSLKDANGYVVSAGAELTLETESVSHDITVSGVSVETITGNITGLGSSISDLKLVFEVPEGYVYEPELAIDTETATYELKVEKDVVYTLTAENVNDYELETVTIGTAGGSTADIVFAAKPVYPISITVTGVEDTSEAVVTFTNINEEGYSYSFGLNETMELRDGSYSIKVTGLDKCAVAQGVTANLNVNGASASAEVTFAELSEWDFSVLNTDYDIVSIDGTSYYVGLVLSGNVLENKTYLLANAESTITIPDLKAGDTVTISYCYSAAFTVGEITVDEKSGSTAAIDSVAVTADADGDLVIENIKGANASQTYFCSFSIKRASDVTEYAEVLYVGADREFTTVNDALAYIRKMDRTDDQNVTVMIDPGDYEEMLVIDIPNITLKNASSNPSIELKDKGVNIDDNAVRITWYYGHGYTYYSMGSDSKYNAELLAANISNGYASYENPGAGTTNGSYWNATVVISADNFSADGIIFENSFNQYVSAKSVEDVIVAQSGAKEGSVARSDMKTAGDTTVQYKEYVERAAALAITNNVQEAYFNNCKFVGRQDTLYGGTGVTAAFEKCSVYGGTDYIFGGMTAVFKECDLVFNTNDETSKGEKDDVGYITAPQQSSGRGYLMYECHITSTIPGVDTASIHTSKPGYFGRPWQANTSEAVFYNTTIDAADEFWNTGSYAFGESLIREAGWLSTLGGESSLAAEYGTIEESGVDNSGNRASWAGVLSEAVLSDGTAISIEAFLGDWYPFTETSDETDTPVTPDGSTETGVITGQGDSVTSVSADEDIIFTDASGEDVTDQDIIIAVELLDAPVSEEIRAAVEKITGSDIIVDVLYFDITAYSVSVSPENIVTLSDGIVKIKMEYPEGVSRNNEIIVLHGTSQVKVTKDNDGYWIYADGFSPYTVIIKSVPVTVDDDDDDTEETTDAAQPIQPEEQQTEQQQSSAEEGTAQSDVNAEGEAPETGDGTPTALMAALALVSLVGMSVTFKLKKRFE